MTPRDVCLASAACLLAAGPLAIPAFVLFGGDAGSGLAWMAGLWELAGFALAGGAQAGREERRGP